MFPVARNSQVAAGWELSALSRGTGSRPERLDLGAEQRKAYPAPTQACGRLQSGSVLFPSLKLHKRPLTIVPGPARPDLQLCGRSRKGRGRDLRCLRATGPPALIFSQCRENNARCPRGGRVCTLERLLGLPGGQEAGRSAATGPELRGEGSTSRDGGQGRKGQGPRAPWGAGISRGLTLWDRADTCSRALAPSAGFGEDAPDRFPPSQARPGGCLGAWGCARVSRSSRRPPFSALGRKPLCSVQLRPPRRPFPGEGAAVLSP